MLYITVWLVCVIYYSVSGLCAIHFYSGPSSNIYVCFWTWLPAELARISLGLGGRVTSLQLQQILPSWSIVKYICTVYIYIYSISAFVRQEDLLQPTCHCWRIRVITVILSLICISKFNDNQSYVNSVQKLQLSSKLDQT